MVALIKTLQVILALSILIIIHEAGHFFFAKIFHIRVEKFYLFFDMGGKYLLSTKRSKLLTRLFPKLKDAETDYGIGWLPLGGYCKISGMIDESMDTEQLKHEARDYEFRAHPAWQRLLVMAGGVLFNFILAIAVYIGLLAHNGKTILANDECQIYAGALAQDMGFRTGDRILAFDDYVPENFSTLQMDLVRKSPRVAYVLRDNDTIKLYMDHARDGEILNTPDMFQLAVPFVIDTVVEGSVNYGAGLMHDDRIIALDGTEVTFVQDSRALLMKKAGGSVEATILRGEEQRTLTLQVDTLGRIGVYNEIPGIRTREYTLAEAIPAGFALTFENIGGYLRDLKLVATPSTGAYKSVGSFIAIGQVFPSNWDWNQFLSIIALLSIMLGVMNLIPIPALDGGHIVITLYEIITRRKPSDKVLIVVQTIGMILLFMLMILAFGNDITRLIK